jgi:hypothetical protein
MGKYKGASTYITLSHDQKPSLQSSDLRGASYYGRGVERTSNKLPSRGQGRSLLKYINCRICISLERKVCPLKESLGFHKYYRQVFFHRTNFWCQNSQKVMPCRCSGVLFRWPLAFSMKAKRTKFRSSPIKLLKSLVNSTNNRSVKCP